MKHTKNTTCKCILAFDPSITAWGYALIDVQSKQIVAAECIKTASENKKRRIRKGDDDVRRIIQINSVLLDLIKKYNVVHIVTEQPHGSKNASAAKMIGVVLGVIQTISDCTNIGVDWFSEADSKQALLGKHAATKQETIDVIDNKYKVKWTNADFRNEAIADALSIYHLACIASPTVKLLLNESGK